MSSVLEEEKGLALWLTKSIHRHGFIKMPDIIGQTAELSRSVSEAK